MIASYDAAFFLISSHSFCNFIIIPFTTCDPDVSPDQEIEEYVEEVGLSD